MGFFWCVVSADGFLLAIHLNLRPPFAYARDIADTLVPGSVSLAQTLVVDVLCVGT